MWNPSIVGLRQRYALIGIGELLRRAVGYVLLRHKRARAEAEMRAMDESELHDLGMGRGEIGYAARFGRGWREM